MRLKDIESNQKYSHIWRNSVNLKDILLDNEPTNVSGIDLCLTIGEISNDLIEIKDLKRNTVDLLNIATNLDELVKRAETVKLSQNDYFYFKKQLDDFSERTGIEFNAPSFENFNNSSLSLEDIRAIAKKIKESVINVKKKIMSKLQKVLEKVKNMYTPIYKRVESFQEKIKNMEGKTLKDENRKMSYNLNGLIVSGQGVDDIEKNLDNTLSELNNFSNNDKIKSSVTQYHRKVAVGVEKFINDKEAIPLLMTAADATKEYFKVVINLPVTKRDNSSVGKSALPDRPKDWKIVKRECLLGNKCIYSYYPDSDFKLDVSEPQYLVEDLILDVHGSGIVLKEYSDEKVTDKTTFDVLPLSDIKRISDLILECYQLMSKLDLDNLSFKVNDLNSNEVQKIKPIDIEVSAEQSLSGKLPLGWCLDQISLSPIESFSQIHVDLIDMINGNILKVINFCEQNLNQYG